MPTIVDLSAIDQVFLLHEGDKVIARPGEPIQNIEVNIDAVTARRKATSYIGREISMMMGGRDPALVSSRGRLIWRVPIIFTTPFEGQLGVVGVVDIDIHTSELLIPPNLEETLRANAEALLKDLPHSPKG